MTWRDHIASMRQKCFGSLAKVQRMKDVLPVDLKWKFFNAFVLPCRLLLCGVQECTKELIAENQADPKEWDEADTITTTMYTK